MQVRSLGQEDPLEEGTARAPAFLPGEAHGQTKPIGLQSIGSQRVGRDQSDLAPLFELGAGKGSLQD